MSVEAEKWDGRPRHTLTTDEARALYAFVPQWLAVAEGPPVPFAGDARCRVAVNAIFSPTREEAIECLRRHVRSACERERMEFDEDDWTVTQVLLLGGS